MKQKIKQKSMEAGRAITHNRLLAHFYNFGKCYSNINEFSGRSKKIQGAGDYFQKWAQKFSKYFSLEIIIT